MANAVYRRIFDDAFVMTSAEKPIRRDVFALYRTRTRTNTNPNGTEANAAGRSGNARALREQSKCGMIQEGEGHWPNSSKNLQKARNVWVLRAPQNNKEEGARARKLVTCGTRSSLGRGQIVPFSAQGAYVLSLSHRRL